MIVRTFHQLESDNNGLDIFNKWLSSEKNPIKGTDISLIFEGKEYADTEVDHLAFGSVVTPCLTPANLIACVSKMTDEEKERLKKILEI